MKRFIEHINEASPIVKDYLKHVERAVKSHSPQAAQKHLSAATATHGAMNAKGKREAESRLPDDHKEWLKRARENDL